jgi:hypothetical protein
MFRRYENPKSSAKSKSAEITESSGIVASKCSRTFSGRTTIRATARLFTRSTKRRKSSARGKSGRKITIGKTSPLLKMQTANVFLYIGDIGDNERGRKKRIYVYQSQRTAVSDADKSSSRKNPLTTESAEAIKFEYPGFAHDAETLLVHPQTGDIYVLTKRLERRGGRL